MSIPDLSILLLLLLGTESGFLSGHVYARTLSSEFRTILGFAIGVPQVGPSKWLKIATV